MTERLGNALYALGCIVAGAVLLVMVPVTITGIYAPDTLGVWISASIIALIAWLIGRGCRYVLAGR